MSLESLTPDELAFLNVGKLLLEHPEVKRDAQRLIKKARPQTVIPEIDLEDRLLARETELTKRQQEMEDRLNKEALERRIEKEREAVREMGIDVSALETFMKENELYSYPKAAKIFQQVNQPASPTPASLMTDIKGMAGDEAKKLWSNPTQYARDVAKQVHAEFAGQRGRAA